MKGIFLFLYPIRQYLNVELERLGPESFDWDPMWINSVIHARYRQQDWQIYWLMFGHELDRYRPDMALWSKHMLLHRNDKIISAGVTFCEMMYSQRYADPAVVERQFDQPVTDIRLGGFHQGDCVEKLARHFYERGCNTLVDEDLTELFFGRMMTEGVPLIRDERCPFRPFPEGSPILYWRRVIQKTRPWLVQY